MASNPTRDRVNTEVVDTTPLRRPSWIRVRAPSGETYEWLQSLMRKKALHTVCEEAGCPNMGECWSSGTATFLMMGDVCTRTCGFCDIKHGSRRCWTGLEPERVAQAVKVDGAQTCRDHQRQPRRAQRRRRADFRHGHPPHPPAFTRAPRSRC